MTYELNEELVGRLRTCKEAGPSYFRLYLIVTDILDYIDRDKK
jgi:hypothetical protein